MQRGIVEEHAFRAELNSIISDPKESDEVCEAAFAYLSLYADLEPELDGTRLFYKLVPYPKLNRMIVLWYTIDDFDDRVVLKSATSFPIPAEE